MVDNQNINTAKVGSGDGFEGRRIHVCILTIPNLSLGTNTQNITNEAPLIIQRRESEEIKLTAVIAGAPKAAPKAEATKDDTSNTTTSPRAISWKIDRTF